MQARMWSSLSKTNGGVLTEDVSPFEMVFY